MWGVGSGQWRLGEVELGTHFIADQSAPLLSLFGRHSSQHTQRGPDCTGHGPGIRKCEIVGRCLVWSAGKSLRHVEATLPCYRPNLFSAAATIHTAACCVSFSSTQPGVEAPTSKVSPPLACRHNQFAHGALLAKSPAVSCLLLV